MACILEVVTKFAAAPLVRWDGLHLVISLEQAEAILRERVALIEHVASVHLDGGGDSIEAVAVLQWKGIRTRVAVTVGEIRLKRRFLGFRIRRVKVFGGIRIPRTIVESVLGAFGGGLISVMPGSKIVVVDLRRWIPAEADVSIVTVQATSHSLHFWFAPGSLARIPQQVRALPRGEVELAGSKHEERVDTARPVG